MRSATWSAQVRNRQESPDVTRHPVIGKSNMVEDVEVHLHVEFPRSEVGTYLPKVGVELNAPWKPQQRVHPTRQIHKMERQVGNRLELQFRLDPNSIGDRGESPIIMKPCQLPRKVPVQRRLTPTDGRA